MTKAEKLEAYLKEELYDIYCHNCRHADNDENDNCDYCHRKNMYWQVSDEVIEKACDIAERKEE